MAKKQPTKKPESATEARLKTKQNTEADGPPKVVSAIGQGKFLVREASMKVHEVGPMEPHKYKIQKPTSSNAESHTYVTGSKHGAVVYSSVSGKVETSQSGQSTPTSD